MRNDAQCAALCTKHVNMLREIDQALSVDNEDKDDNEVQKTHSRRGVITPKLEILISNCHHCQKAAVKISVAKRLKLAS